MTTGEAIKTNLKLLYTKPSINDNISYTLVSLINHDGDSLDCGHYVSDVFDASTGIWWHCDYYNITQISDLPNGVYYIETQKHTKNKNKKMAGPKDVLFVVYTRTTHLKNTQI